MNYEIVELPDLSGNKAKIYSIIPENEDETLFDNFIVENITGYRDEVKDIIKRIHQIGNTTGARISFFKPHEGKHGDFVCALFDIPEKNLRLYCIRFGMVAVILGGGGVKDVRAWQDDPKLTKEVTLMMAYAEDILQRIDDGDIYWSKDKTELEGNLKNYNES